MNICVFGAASAAIDEKYIVAVEELCKALGQRGHGLVFGGGATGIMGAAARGFRAGGGKITGVIPRFFADQGIENLYTECDNVIYTYDLSERKSLMINNSNAFIVGPGGVGTYDEFFEILTLKNLGRHSKPIIVFNVNGFYDLVVQMVRNARDEKFIKPGILDMIEVFDEPNKLIEYLENS